MKFLDTLKPKKEEDFLVLDFGRSSVKGIIFQPKGKEVVIKDFQTERIERFGVYDGKKFELEIVKKALEEPIRQIAANSGKEGAEVIAKIKDNKNEKYGYNADKDSYEDLFEAGVLDPTKVVRNTLQNSTSIASMVLTTEALVTDFDEEKDKPTATIVI